MATLGDLVVRIQGKDQLTPVLGKAQGSLTSFVARMSRQLATLTGALGAALGVGGGAAALGFGIKLAAEAESAEVAFGTLLGSAAAARKSLADLSDFAAATPFEFPELTNAARKLIAFGTAQADMIPVLRRVGDISSGIGAPISEIAELYGKAQVQGRLFMEDINQLTGRGIPIIGALAKQFGVAQSEVRELVSSGQVHFKNLEKAFISLTSEGGQFAGMMEAQSRTLDGLWSTFKDNLSLTLRDIGAAIIRELDFKGLLANAISLTETIGGTLVSGFSRFIQTITGAAQWVREFVSAHWETIRVVGQFLAIAGTVAGTIAGASAAMSGFGAAAAAAMALAMTPISPLVLAIGGISAALVQATGDGETFGAKLNSIFSRIPDMVDGLGFTFRNFGNIAKLAFVDWGITILETFPMIQRPVEILAGFMAGMWSGAKAAFSTFLQNVLAGFQEIKNMFSAIIAGIKAAFTSVISGDLMGAAGAFGEAFTKTLANQADVKGGGNPFSAFQDAFSETQRQVSDGFANKPMVDQLRSMKDSLLNDIATSEVNAAAAAAEAARQIAPEETIAAKAAEEEDAGAKSKKPPPGAAALQKGSSAAFSAIQAAIRSGTKSAAEKAAKDTASNTKKTADTLKNIESKLGQNQAGELPSTE